jgi:cation diffusion facilitator CzcD-associated flavoprotein CzcO
MSGGDVGSSQLTSMPVVTRRRRRDDRVTVIGAGPYGLAVTAYLRLAGLEVHCFGEAMATWRRHMPMGMVLCSPRRATQIPDPRGALTLQRYEMARGSPRPKTAAVRLDDFVAYGRWFQSQVIPDLDRRMVVRVQSREAGFRILLDDGERIDAGRVVVAAGLIPFAWRPPPFVGHPPSLVSHSSDHHDLGAFAGKRVLVVGSGQSALESAALLSEHGTEVELLVRARQVHWRRRWFHTHGPLVRPLARLMYAPSAVGPAGVSWIAETPGLFWRLQSRLQRLVVETSLRPEPDLSLSERLGEVRITTGQTVVSATVANSQLRLGMDDGTERAVDHVLLATGFRVDIARYPFIGPELLLRLRRIRGFPVLGPGLESSVPGFHLLGAPAARSFGPLMSFIAGARYAAKAVTAHILAARN